MNATSLVGYTSDGFDLKLHEKLFKMLHELKRGVVKSVSLRISINYGI